jgi:hypothetical protein
MLVDLRQHDIGQDGAAAVVGALDHGGGSLVAGGFDAEHQHPALAFHLPFAGRMN